MKQLEDSLQMGVIFEVVTYKEAYHLCIDNYQSQIQTDDEAKCRYCVCNQIKFVYIKARERRRQNQDTQ